MAAIITLITKLHPTCAEVAYIGSADLHRRASGNCTGGSNLVQAGMRNGDSVDVQPNIDAGSLSFDFMNITGAPGFQVRSSACGHQGNLCILIGGGFPVTRVSAFEAQATQTLTVSQDDVTQPPITSSPSGINCGADCTEVYTTNTVVTLTAGLNPGFALDFWEVLGAGQGPDLFGNPLVLTMDRSWVLKAHYTQAIVVIGDGRATIVNVTTDLVVVEAIPAPNSYLVGISCPP